MKPYHGRVPACGVYCSVHINQRMKEIGVDAYYDEIKDKPRYKIKLYIPLS